MLLHVCSWSTSESSSTRGSGGTGRSQATRRGVKGTSKTTTASSRKIGRMAPPEERQRSTTSLKRSFFSGGRGMLQSSKEFSRGEAPGSEGERKPPLRAIVAEHEQVQH